MWLVKTYKGNDQMDEAIALCQQRCASEREYVQIWARQFLSTHAPDVLLQVEPEPEPVNQPVNVSPGGSFRSPAARSQSHTKESSFSKAGRALQMGVKLPMQAVAANLSIASGATLLLLSGMVLGLCLSFLFKSSRLSARDFLSSTPT